MRRKLGRLCVRCGKKFIPNGKYQRVCDKCMKKINLNRRKIKEHL